MKKHLIVMGLSLFCTCAYSAAGKTENGIHFTKSPRPVSNAAFDGTVIVAGGYTITFPNNVLDELELIEVYTVLEGHPDYYALYYSLAALFPDYEFTIDN